LRPRKKIPSFCFKSPWLKPFDLNSSSVIVGGTRRLRATWNPELVQDLEAYHNIDAESELTRLLTEEINREIIENIRVNTIAQDLVPVQPMGEPTGRLFYFDFNYGPVEEPVVYKDGSWSLGNSFEGIIGIKSEIKSHTFI